MQHSLFADDCQLHLHYAGAQNLPIGKPFFNPLHNDPDATELLLICGGGGTYQFDGILYEAKPHTILFYNQGLWHEERSYTHIPYVTMYLAFGGLQLKGFPVGFFIERHISPLVELGDNFFAIEQLLREIVHVKNTPSPEAHWIADHLLGVFLGELAKLIHHRNFLPQKEQNASKSIMLLKKHIHENYNKTITLDRLSEVAHISPFHLSRLFNKETGDSPIQYLMKYRLEVAKQYLLSTNDTIEAIAERIGYESEAHFQHIFKRLVGIPPGKFRASHKID